MQLPPRSAQSLLLLVLSLVSGGLLHGVAAAQVCPTYTVVPAVQTNCSTLTYSLSTCVLSSWCLS